MCSSPPEKSELLNFELSEVLFVSRPYRFPSAVGIVAAGIASYLTALAALPEAGWLSSLPTAGVLALVASHFCRKDRWQYAFMGCMPFCFTCLMGQPISRAVLCGLSCLAQTFFVLLAKRAFRTVRHEKAAVRTKSTIVLAASVIAALAAWLFVFGNPISLFLSQSRTMYLAEEKYADAVQMKSSTHYDPFSRLYLTSVSFEQAERGTDYYMSLPTRDDYADFCRERLYQSARDYFEKQTTLERESVYVYLDENGAPLAPDTPFEAFRADMEYLLPLTAGITDVEDFKIAVEQTERFLTLSDTFEYRRVILAASGTDGEAYYAVLEDGVWHFPQTGSEEYRTLDDQVTAKFPNARHI